MKALIVTGDDYGAVHFENTHRGTSVSEIIKSIEQDGDESMYQAEEDADEYFELEVREVGEVSPEFLKFIRGFIDYDDSKHRTFYLENETV